MVDLTRHITHNGNGFGELGKSSVSKKTRSDYLRNLGYLSQWMEANHYTSDNLPLSTSLLRAYAEDMVKKGKALTTIMQRLWAVSWLHKYKDYPTQQNPMYAPEMRFIHREIKELRAYNGLENKPNQKHPLTAQQIRKLCRKCPDSLSGKRNKAMILVGFAGALRRSELANLKTSDMTLSPDNKQAVICIKNAKADKLKTGQAIAIHAAKDQRYCPLHALTDFLNCAGIKRGYLFPKIINGTLFNQPVSGVRVSIILKQLCQQCEIDPANIAGHSLRRGLLVESIKKGTDLNTLRIHARHAESSMTEHYIGQAYSQKACADKGIL